MSKPTYLELLRDPRWQRKRLEVMERADFACEECGDKSTTLNVHHKLYRKGAMPWEYADEELGCLCETCHEAEHTSRDALKTAIASMRLYQLERLLGYAEAIGLTCAEGSRQPTKVRSESHAEGLMDGLWNWNSGKPDQPSSACLVDHRFLDDDLFCMLGDGEMPAPDWKAQH